VVKDEFPLQFSQSGPGMWLQDLIAPFGIYRHLEYESGVRVTSGGAFHQTIDIYATQSLCYSNRSLREIECGIKVQEKKILEFSFLRKGEKINVQCKSKV
jgi:hypothetical protein